MKRESLEKQALNNCPNDQIHLLHGNISTKTDNELIEIITEHSLLTYEITKEPMLCKKCGTETEFDVLNDNSQLHQCLSCSCMFFAE